MLRTADNVFSIVLDDNASTTANLPAVGTVVTPANTPAGSVVIVDMGMRRMNTAAYAAADRYRIVQSKGAGKQLMISPEITKASATLSTSRHTAAVQQVSVVGFNGTTGALPVANSTDFFIKIRKNDNDAANRSQPMSLFAGPVKTSATATQIELANALVKNGIANFRDEPANNYLTFSALSSNAGVAVTGTAVSLVWTKGSREVTSAAVNKTITNVVAGTFVKVAAATTTSVYKVKSFVQGSATTKAIITLDYAFQEESVTVARATNMMITKTLAEAGTAGVRMTGVQANFDVNAFRDYYVNRFSVAFSDVSTLVTTTGARTGSGMFQQVAMDEYMSYGFEGMNGMLGVPPAMRDQDVKIPGTGTVTALTSRYSCLEISWTESIQGLVSLQGGKGSVLVYVNLGNQNPLGLLGATSTGYELVHGVLALGANILDMQ
jgi:hypothetical protein